MDSISPERQSLARRIGLFLVLTLGLILLLIALVPSLSALTSWIPTLFPSPLLQKMTSEWTILLVSVLVAVRILDAFGQKLGWPGLGFTTERFAKGLSRGSLTAFLILGLCFLILLVGGWVKIVNIDLSPSLLFGWFLFFLIQPLAEEVLMRSFLQNQLHRLFGPWVGLFGSALVFGMLHMGNNAFTWIAGLEIMAGGFLMGLLFLYTQNIWGAFAMHAVWNFLQSTVMGFAVSGLDTYKVLALDVSGPSWLTGGDFGLEGSVLSLLLLLVAIWYHWTATQQTVPALLYQKQPIAEDNSIDESNSI